LFVTWEGGGNQWPTLAIARALGDHGHSVRIAGYDSQQQPLARMGFDVALLARGGSKPTGPDRLRAVFEGVFCNHDHIADVADQAADFGPDVLVVDCLLFGALAGAEALGLPVATLVHSAPRALAEGPGMAQLVQGVNALRTDVGLEAVADVLSAWTRGPALATSIAELDGEAPSPGFDFVGPIADERDGVWASPWPPTDQRPLIVASLSTGQVFGDQTPRYQRIADALADVSARVLITTGGAVDETSLRLGENVRAVRFVSHPAVLRDAAACITHGGHGTLCAALRAGLPVLCLPNPAADQPYLAQRIANLEAGLSLDRDSPTTAIRHALIDLLDSIEYRRAAEHLASRIRESTGTDGASSMLLALA
jgi:MGT family glycosyltransferase